MKLPDKLEECYRVSVVDTMVDEEVQYNFKKKYPIDAIESSLLAKDVDEDDEEIFEYLNMLNALPKFHKSLKQVEPLNLPTKIRAHAKPSIKEPPHGRTQAITSPFEVCLFG